MKDYSYAEIMKMQEQAAERVRDMKRRAIETTESARNEFDNVPNGKNNAQNFVPINQSKNHIPLENNITSDQIPPLSKSNRYYTQSENISDKDQHGASLLDFFSHNSDSALLASLLFLLIDSRADESIILAILYILL